MTTNPTDNVEVSDLFRKDPEEVDDTDLEKMVAFYRQWRAKMAADDKVKTETKKAKKSKVEPANILDKVA